VYGGGDTKKNIEGFYGEGGVKVATLQDKIGNVHYYSFGMTHRPSYCSRIWHSFTYLNQDFHGDGYKQYEYFVSINNYIGHYFYIRPSFHYAYTSFTSSTSSNQPYFISNSHVVPNGIVTYEVNGTQIDYFSTPGSINSLNLSAAISKRLGSFVFEAEPSLHYINYQRQANSNSVINGVADTFINGTLINSGTYVSNTSNPLNDTVSTNRYFQLSTGITFRLPLEFVTLRVMGHLVRDKNDQDIDASFYAFVRTSNLLWLHISYVEKGDLPLALNNDGQYFNAGNPVKSRVGFSVQLHPLKKFTQYLTYQHEEQGKFNTKENYQFNSFYLTLKYIL
jgi:hypothetical protein